MNKVFVTGAVWLASPESNGITSKLISVHHDYRSLTA